MMMIRLAFVFAVQFTLCLLNVDSESQCSAAHRYLHFPLVHLCMSPISTRTPWALNGSTMIAESSFTPLHILPSVLPKICYGGY
ncbi:uncharacterized protein HD556DRAFT_1390260 [Suillus plorans]|uniref:Secreted protein n=1 Tax=Suillus plorans TaxID=116603 RepID=A0A9P7AJM8_9AGAM|nr:uncharacterized protein HD556DRAFT_1390260 [Suillus plorans]KAG1790707.1 hypothetical protein HD556DRAFT_1390260 [Suillus plorans]